MSGDWLLHSGAFLGWNFGTWNPPWFSLQPKNALELGLPLIHPEICKWLYIHRISLSGSIRA
ncbi:MAG: hypothetical protein R8M38_00025 [Mariprofundaceae bacterium]